MGPLRFCMLTTFYPPYHFGGDGVFVRRLSHALARRGHHVEVVHDVDAYALARKEPLPDPLPEPEGVRVHRLRSRLGRLSCLATQQTGRPIVHGRRIQRILADGRFDVIHYHNVSLVGGPGLLAYGEGIKLYTAHEHWLVCPTHTLWRHNREACAGRDCLRCTIKHRRPPQYWRGSGLLEAKVRHVDAFISPSRFSAQKHAEFGFARPLTVIPNFIADDEPAAVADDNAAPVSHPRPYFLFVGRLEAMKGVQDLLPHFQTAPPADLLIAGSGSDEAHLRAAAQGSPHIRFLGRLSPAALRPLYRQALAAVIPSLCYETFGMTTLEAFREQTPVITRARGPLPEIVEQSGGGLLFETPEQLADALKRLADDDRLRQQLGTAGRQALDRYWSEEVVLGQYFDLIRDVAARKTSAA